MRDFRALPSIAKEADVKYAGDAEQKSERKCYQRTLSRSYSDSVIFNNWLFMKKWQCFVWRWALSLRKWKNKAVDSLRLNSVLQQSRVLYVRRVYSSRFSYALFKEVATAKRLIGLLTLWNHEMDLEPLFPADPSYLSIFSFLFDLTR